MWTSIRWDIAGVVNHFVENHDSSGSLDDLIVVVVRTRKHRRPGSPRQEASFVFKANRSSGPSAGCSLLASARSRTLFRASGVRGGIRPSGGSTIKEVFRVFTTFDPRSYQAAL